MFHADQGYLAATNEMIVMNIDYTSRRSAPWPVQVAERPDAVWAIQRAAQARQGRPRHGPYEKVRETRLVCGDPANPRKTNIARSKRRTSSGASQPMCVPSFAFATVVILSTISRDGWRSPLLRSARPRLNTRFSVVSRESADVMDAVASKHLLHNDYIRFPLFCPRILQISPPLHLGQTPRR